MALTPSGGTRDKERPLWQTFVNTDDASIPYKETYKAGTILASTTAKLVPPEGSGLLRAARGALHLSRTAIGIGVVGYGPAAIANISGYYPISASGAPRTTVITTQDPVYLLADDLANPCSVNWIEFPKY